MEQTPRHNLLRTRETEVQNYRGNKVSYQVNPIHVPSPGQPQATDICREPVSE
jgi:hypothetical protein